MNVKNKRKSVTLSCDVMQIFWGKDISQYSFNVEDCGKIPLKVDIDLSYTEYLDYTVEGLVDWCRVYWNWATDPQKFQLTKDEWENWNEQGLEIARRIRAVIPKKWRLYYLYQVPGERFNKFYIGKKRNIPVWYFGLEQWIRRKIRKIELKYRQKHPKKIRIPNQTENQNITVHCKKEDGWAFAVYTTIQDEERKSWAEVYDYKTNCSARFLTVNEEIPTNIEEIQFFMFSPKRLETETKEKLLKWFNEKPVRGSAAGCDTNWQAIKQAWKDMRELEDDLQRRKSETIR